MLIISIIMSIRKNITLRLAYALLTGSTICVIAYDAHLRSEVFLRTAQIERARDSEPAAPVPLNPIAQSPFLEARPGASDSRISANTPGAETAPSPIYFLKVPVRVDCGSGSVALNRGTPVKLLRQQAGKLLVTRNGAKFLIEKSQVTDDIASLSALARNSS